jgi:hypothetical protein
VDHIHRHRAHFAIADEVVNAGPVTTHGANDMVLDNLCEERSAAEPPAWTAADNSAAVCHLVMNASLARGF